MKWKSVFGLYSLLLAAGLLLLLSACSSQITSVGKAGGDQPCWVDNDPACDDQGDEYLYFVGQNAVKDAAKGRPNRSAFDSARIAAKAQYVSYLEETVSVKAAEAFTNAGESEEGAETVAGLKQLIKTFAQKTVSGLKQLDSYYVSDAANSKGTPLWSVFVRMRIAKQEVREKFGLLADNMKKSAKSGNEKAKDKLEGIQTIQKKMKEDDFFKGF